MALQIPADEDYSAKDVKLDYDETTIMMYLDWDSNAYLNSIINFIGTRKLYGLEHLNENWLNKIRKKIPTEKIEITLIRLCIKGFAEVNSNKAGDYFNLKKQGRIWCRYNLDEGFKLTQKCFYCKEEIVTCIIKGMKEPEDVFCNKHQQYKFLLDEVKSAKESLKLNKGLVEAAERDLKQAQNKLKKWMEKNKA